MADTLGNVGIMPLPGTPAYAAALRNLLNAQTSGYANLGDQQQQGINSMNTLLQNTGEGDFGLLGNTAAAKAGAFGGSGGSSGSLFSNQATGAGLLDEILGLIRGTGEKQFGTARRRLAEDYGLAKSDKNADLARKGLFRAGIGEEEMQRQVDMPFQRGSADLESNMADANTDLGLRKASILAEIEAQARRQAAQGMSSASMTGTGAYNPFGSRGSTGGSFQYGDSGSGGMFGATFGGGGGGGGGTSTSPASWTGEFGWGGDENIPPPMPGDALGGIGSGLDPGAEDPWWTAGAPPGVEGPPMPYGMIDQGSGVSLYGNQQPNMQSMNYFASMPAYGGGGGGNAFSSYI